MWEALAAETHKMGAGIEPVPYVFSIVSTRFIAVISSILMVGCQALAHVTKRNMRNSGGHVALPMDRVLGAGDFRPEHHREPLAKLLERRLFACPLQKSLMDCIGELQSVFG